MQIIVDVKDVTDKYILKQEVGHGSYKGVEFQLCSIVGSQSPLLEFNDKVYVVHTSDIVKAIIDNVTEENTNND